MQKILKNIDKLLATDKILINNKGIGEIFEYMNQYTKSLIFL